MPHVMCERVLLLLALVLSAASASAQCTNPTAFGSASAPTVVGQTVNFTTCAFAGEYSTMTDAQLGSIYRFQSSVGTDFLTIRSGTPAGTALAWGGTPVDAMATEPGSIYLHVNTNEACGTALTCRSLSATLLEEGFIFRNGFEANE